MSVVVPLYSYNELSYEDVNTTMTGEKNEDSTWKKKKTNYNEQCSKNKTKMLKGQDKMKTLQFNMCKMETTNNWYEKKWQKKQLVLITN